MVDQEELKRRQSMTFEEAEGLVDPPAQFRDGNLTREFRNRLWTLFYALLSKCLYDSDRYNVHEITAPLDKILVRELLNHRHTPIDEINIKLKYRSELDKFISVYKEIILNQDANNTLGFVQCILRDQDCPKNLIQAIENLFSEISGSYSFFPDPPTIMPIASEVERGVVGQALRDVN